MKNLSYNKKLYYNAGVLTAGLAFIIHNTIDFSFFMAQGSFLWWVVLALNASITQINTDKRLALQISTDIQGYKVTNPQGHK